MYNPLLNNLAQSNAYLKDVDGIPPDQQLQIAIDKAQKGLIPFGVAIALKGAADTLRQRGAPSQMPEPDNPMMKIIKELQGGQGQPQMPQQQMPQQPQMPQGQDPRLAAGVGSLPTPVMDQGPVQSMKGGGIVAFSEGDVVEEDDRSQAEIDRANEQQRLLDLRDRTDAERAARQRNETAGINNWLGHIADYWRAPAAKFNAYNPPATPAAAPAGAAPATVAAPGTPDPMAVTLPDYPAGLLGLSGSMSASGGIRIPAFRQPNMKPLQDLVAAAQGRIPKNAPGRAAFDKEAQDALTANEGYKSVLGYQNKLKGKGTDIDARAKEQNRMLTAMLGFQWAANAAKPGARFLGSFAEAGVPYAKDIMALRQRVEDSKDALEDKQMRVAQTLAEYRDKADDKSYAHYTEAKKDYSDAVSHSENLGATLAQAEQQAATAANSYGLGMAGIQAQVARYGKDKIKDQLASQFSSDRQEAYKLRGQAERMPPSPERDKALATAAGLEKRANYTYETYQKVDLTYGNKAAEIDLKTKALLEKDSVYRRAMITLQSSGASRDDQMKAMKNLRMVADKYHIDPALLGIPSAELGGGVLTLDADGNLVSSGGK